MRRAAAALVAQRLLEAGAIARIGADGHRAHARRARRRRAVETPGQEVVRPARPSDQANGGLVILRGNLAPEGAVMKVSGAGRVAASRAGAGVRQRGGGVRRPCSARRIKPGDVVVIRYEGPSGGPGMREMLARDRRVDGRGPRRLGRPRDRRTVLRCDARPHGRPCRARGVPRRTARRRPRRRHRSSSISTIGASTSSIERRARLQARLATWKAPAPRYASGVLAKYARLVSSASTGAVTGRAGTRIECRLRSEPISLQSEISSPRLRGSMKLTGAQILWESLVREGVTDVFGYPGGAILPAYDAMLGYPIRHVLVRHEQGATHMADGYARASGKVGVAIATSGPGATNMVTGIATAMMDSLAHRLHHRPGGQQADRIRRVSGNRHHRHHAADHEAQLPGDQRRRTSRRRARGVRRRASGRPGPVLVDITKDAQQASCEVRLGRGGAASHGSLRRRAAGRRRFSRRDRADQRRRAAADSRRARRHAVGRRARIASRSPSGRSIPIAVTLLGIGGVPGVASAQSRHDGHARRGVGQHRDSGSRPADCARHALRRSRHGQPEDLRARRAKKIHVDIDRAELNKNVRVDVAIAKDLRDGARRMAAARRAGRSRGLARAHRRARRAIRRCATSRTCPTTGTCTPRTSSTTSGASPAATRWSSPTSASTRCGRRSTTSTTRSRSLITSGGLGTMGFALPAAIGAKIACPDAEVWVVVGDGGFQMTMSRARDGGAGRSRHQRRDHQQRVSRHGSAVAGILLREALRGDADQRTRFPEARRGVRDQRGDGAHARGGCGCRDSRATHEAREPSSISRWSRKIRCIRWCRPAPTCTR